MYDLQSIRIKNALGLELEPKEKQLQLAAKVVTMQKNAAAKLDQAQDQLDQAKVEVEKRSDLQQHVHKPGKEKLGPADDKDPQRTDGIFGKLWEVKQLPMATPPRSSDLLIASRMFLATLASAWKQSKLDPMPPGCCYLTGDVELAGSKARCKMGVQAAYDPKTGSFVWINSRPRGFWSHKQVAKGGP
ncbi:MAG: hypothetical protein Q9162_002948 [Coniocarpon cinnabarinum]